MRTNQFTWRIGNEKSTLSRKSSKRLPRNCGITKILLTGGRKNRQSRIEELSMNQERSPSVANQLLSEIQKLQNNANSLTDERDFHDAEGSSSSGSSHVPTRPLNVPSRSEKPSREPAMPNDTRNAMGISGNVS